MKHFYQLEVIHRSEVLLLTIIRPSNIDILGRKHGNILFTGQQILYMSLQENHGVHTEPKASPG